MTEAEDLFHLQNTADWDKWGHPPIIAWSRSKFREHFDDPEGAFAASGRLGIDLSIPLLVRHAFPNCLYSSGAHFSVPQRLARGSKPHFPSRSRCSPVTTPKRLVRYLLPYCGLSSSLTASILIDRRFRTHSSRSFPTTSASITLRSATTSRFQTCSVWRRFVSTISCRAQRETGL